LPREERGSEITGLIAAGPLALEFYPLRGGWRRPVIAGNLLPNIPDSAGSGRFPPRLHGSTFPYDGGAEGGSLVKKPVLPAPAHRARRIHRDPVADAGSIRLQQRAFQRRDAAPVVHALPAVGQWPGGQTLHSPKASRIS
jgi:hypothetical protein